MEEKLIEFMDKALEGVDAGVDFVNAQLPDYIEQLLLWYAVKSGIWFVLGLLGLIGLFILFRKWHHKFIMTHDSDGVLYFIGIFVGIFPFLVFIAMTLGNLDWLQICLAPKVWLVEYISSLAK